MPVIQCLIERDGPTHACVEGWNFTFEQNENGDYVCEVLSPTHVEWFLNFPKSYRLYKPGKEQKTEQPATEQAVVEDQAEAEPVKKNKGGRPKKSK